MAAERPNFYLLLELDPKVDDWPTIQQRLLEKQRAWANDKTMGNPKARRRAESSLALLHDIETLLKDPESRRQEAKDARRQQEAAAKEKLRGLDEAIAILKSGGAPCSEEQIRKLVAELGGAVAEDEVRKRLRAAGVPLAGAAGPAGPARAAKPQIDKVTADKIQQELQHLGHASLYEYLESRPQSSPKALADKAEEIYKENVRLGRTDATASAQNALFGFCKTIFRDDAEKARYDNYLAVQAMEGLKSNIERAGNDNFITRDEMNILIQQARQRGVSAEDARAYVEDYAVKRKWVVQRDSADLPAEALKLCGACGELAPPTAANCPKCGTALEIACPRCGVKNPSANAACLSCGCRTGDFALVDALLREGERLALDGDAGAALRCFDKALLYWPDWKPAIEARRRVEAQHKARETELHALEALVQGAKLTAARTALERFERSHGTAGLDALKKRIHEGLALAEALFAKGEERRRAGDGEAALDRYEEALASCADFESAQRVMAASPPPSPSTLQVTPLGTGFRLSWSAAATGRSVAYRVLRKAGGLPLSAEDGEALGETRGTSLDDAAAAPGTPWYYAVFSLRGGVSCHVPAGSGPHLRLAEVEGLELIAGNGEVSLRWTAPPSCRRVEVWRQQGSPPARPGEGALVPGAGGDAHDTGLTNGQVYGYLAVAVFDDPASSGGELRSAGRTATAIPVAPPAAVMDLQASRNGKSVVLSWTAIVGVQVQIRQTSRLPDYTPGLILPASQADRFGTPVPGASANGAQVTLTGQGQTFFVPLSVASGTAVAGRAVAVTTIDSVLRLAARRAGAGLALTWDWPAGADEILVAWAHDKYPENPLHVQGRQAPVTRREYERAGCWLLPHPERRPHYFSIFTKAPGADLYSLPARIVDTLGQGVTVSYQVMVRKTLLRRSIEAAWIELTCSNGASTTLPAVLVVGKPQSVPLSPKDGQVLAEAPAIRFEQGKATLPIPSPHWPGRPYVRLFFKSSEDAREIRLLPAEQERLRIA
ncbi:MAG TPA: zinc ribbon domain-containing protein [Thermoanaerobaculia bacterium]|nr:zinc ribbon domain-containing protein [Thermoanaerobaculia bacterium]